MCEKQFNRQVDKRLSLILNKFLDESNKSNVSNSETDALKCPFFFYGHLTRLNSKGFEDGKTVAQTKNGNCS